LFLGLGSQSDQIGDSATFGAVASRLAFCFGPGFYQLLSLGFAAPPLTTSIVPNRSFARFSG